MSRQEETERKHATILPKVKIPEYVGQVR